MWIIWWNLSGIRKRLRAGNRNFGENGLKSKELLVRLTDSSNPHYEEYNEALKEADLVTVSIGSNDLMQYLSQSPDVEKLG